MSLFPFWTPVRRDVVIHKEANVPRTGAGGTRAGTERNPCAEAASNKAVLRNSVFALERSVVARPPIATFVDPKAERDRCVRSRGEPPPPSNRRSATLSIRGQSSLCVHVERGHASSGEHL